MLIHLVFLARLVLHIWFSIGSTSKSILLKSGVHHWIPYLWRLSPRYAFHTIIFHRQNIVYTYYYSLSCAGCCRPFPCAVWIFSFFTFFSLNKNLLLLNNHSLTTLHVGQWFAQITLTYTRTHCVHENLSHYVVCMCFGDRDRVTLRVVVIVDRWALSKVFGAAVPLDWPFAGECRFHHETLK